MADTSNIVRTLALQSEDLSKDIDAFADRAFELQRLANTLKERASRTYAEKGVQADQTSSGVIAPAYRLERARRLAPFSFAPFTKKLNWKKLRAMNLDRVVRESDTRSLMEMYQELAHAELEGESVYEMTESNLIKLVRTLQLALQYQQYSLEQGQHMQQLMEEEATQLAAGLKQVPELSMQGLQDGLRNLEKEYYKVADADMDAMFAQARTEERTAARDVLYNNVDQVKQALDINAIPAPAVQQQQGAASSGKRVSYTGAPRMPLSHSPGIRR